MATAVLHFPYLFLPHALETHQLKEPVDEKRGNDGHEQIISGVTKNVITSKVAIKNLPKPVKNTVMMISLRSKQN